MHNAQCTMNVFCFHKMILNFYITYRTTCHCEPPTAAWQSRRERPMCRSLFHFLYHLKMSLRGQLRCPWQSASPASLWLAWCFASQENGFPRPVCELASQWHNIRNAFSIVAEGDTSIINFQSSIKYKIHGVPKMYTVEFLFWSTRGYIRFLYT